MSKLVLSLIVAAVIGGIALVLGTVWGISVYNNAASTKNLYDSKVKANSASFDNMWKTISQSVQISDKQKDALKDIFTSHAAARSQGSDNDKLLMKWVQESVPTVDMSIYKTVLNTITSARDSWTMRQLELVDIARAYNDNLVRFPTNILLKLFGFEKIDAKVITSTRTEKAFETGKDDDVKL